MTYLGTMQTAQRMLQENIISAEDYNKIDTIFKEKYAITLSSLFTDLRLITFGKDANMSH